MKEHEELELLLTNELQKRARMVAEDLPERWGFALMVFPLCEDPDEVQSVLWVSSAQRKSMIPAVEKLLTKWRAENGD